MDIIIRQASVEDSDAVGYVEASCFPEAEAAGKESLEQRIRSFPESFFVAAIDGEIIGLINGCVTNETVIVDELYENTALHLLDGDYQTIFGIDVMPDYRKQGIGAQLMNHMIEASRAAGRKGVILACKKELVRYYEKFGYVNKGKSKSTHGGAEWYDMILSF